MTIETILTPNEILRLFKFSEQHTGQNVVLRITATPLADVLKVTTPSRFKQELIGAYRYDSCDVWKDITDWKGM